MPTLQHFYINPIDHSTSYFIKPISNEHEKLSEAVCQWKILGSLMGRNAFRRTTSSNHNKKMKRNSQWMKGNLNSVRRDNAVKMWKISQKTVPLCDINTELSLILLSVLASNYLRLLPSPVTQVTGEGILPPYLKTRVFSVLWLQTPQQEETRSSHQQNTGDSQNNLRSFPFSYFIM